MKKETKKKPTKTKKNRPPFDLIKGKELYEARKLQKDIDRLKRNGKI